MNRKINDKSDIRVGDVVTLWKAKAENHNYTAVTDLEITQEILDRSKDGLLDLGRGGCYSWNRFEVVKEAEPGINYDIF
jgi:plastocyanin